MSDTKQQPVLHYIASPAHAEGAGYWPDELAKLKARGKVIEIAVNEADLNLLEMLGRARNLGAPLDKMLSRPENQLPAELTASPKPPPMRDIVRSLVRNIIKTVEKSVSASEMRGIMFDCYYVAREACIVLCQMDVRLQDHAIIERDLKRIRIISMRVREHTLRPYTALSLIDELARSAMAVLDGLPDRHAHLRHLPLQSTQRDPGVAGAWHTGAAVPHSPDRLAGEEYRETAIDPARLRDLSQTAVA
jgi:hypothetical protein